MHPQYVGKACVNWVLNTTGRLFTHRAAIATAHVVTLVGVPDRVADLGDDKVRPLFSAF